MHECITYVNEGRIKVFFDLLTPRDWLVELLLPPAPWGHGWHLCHGLALYTAIYSMEDK